MVDDTAGETPAAASPKTKKVKERVGSVAIGASIELLLLLCRIIALPVRLILAVKDAVTKRPGN